MGPTAGPQEAPNCAEMRKSSPFHYVFGRDCLCFATLKRGLPHGRATDAQSTRTVVQRHQDMGLDACGHRAAESDARPLDELSIA